MPIPFLAAMADHDGIRQIQRLDGPWEFRRADGTIVDLIDEDLRFLISLAPAIAATLDRVTTSVSTAQRPIEQTPPTRPSAPQSPSPAARSGKPWSDQEDARLIASLQSGATVSKIAEAFGRTPGAIVARCLHLDVVSITFKAAAPSQNQNGA